MKKSLLKRRIERFNRETGLFTVIFATGLPEGYKHAQHLKSLLIARDLYLKAFKR